MRPRWRDHPRISKRILYRYLVALLVYLGLVGLSMFLPTLRFGPPFLVFLPMFCLMAIFFLQQRRFRRRVQAADYLLCPDCGYALAGHEGIVHCPECGTALDIEAVRRQWRGCFGMPTNQSALKKVDRRQPL